MNKKSNFKNYKIKLNKELKNYLKKENKLKIITNKKTNKTFIHSLSDYAPIMMNDNTGILNFDVAGFACTSNLSKDLYEKYGKKYKIFPSFYILENYSDINLIELNRNKQIQKINSCYFNGLCYGIRETYRNILSQSEFFDFRKKDTAEFYKSKELYYNELSSYKNGFNLDGAAKICYRDLEYFGMGTLLFREKLDVLTYEPIIDGQHYVTIIDDDIKSKIHDPSNYDYIINKLENNIKEITENEKLVTDIVGEARGYFERNVLPENQVEILFSFLKDFEIFK